MHSLCALNQNSQALNSSAEPQPINYLRATTAKPHRFLAPLHAIVGALAMRKKSRVKEVVLCHEELLTPPLIANLNKRDFIFQEILHQGIFHFHKFSFRVRGGCIRLNFTTFGLFTQNAKSGKFPHFKLGKFILVSAAGVERGTCAFCTHLNTRECRRGKENAIFHSRQVIKRGTHTHAPNARRLRGDARANTPFRSKLPRESSFVYTVDVSVMENARRARTLHRRQPALLRS